MLRRLINWFKGDSAPQRKTATQHRRRASAHAAVKTAAAHPEQWNPGATSVHHDPHFHGHVESRGPGKNVLVRNKYIREDTGTHETLKIVDDTLVDSGEEDGIDPYNSGEFDRSKNWNQRFRK